MVPRRVWVAGTVSGSRDKGLADEQQPSPRDRSLRPVLILTDGCAAYAGSIRRVFREKVKATAGRGCLRVWPELPIGKVIKRTEKKREVEMTRKQAHGLFEQAEQFSGGRCAQ